MKNFKNIFTLLVVALAGLSLTACSNNDLDTDQFQGGVALNVYGPSPVMRGGQLRFIGSNLDQVREVIIPSNISITNIQVVRAGTPSEIRVTVPKDGPVEGFVTLVTNSDQRITTKTPLKYEEGIEITAMPTKAMPGDVIKIEGDYLNLIHSLAFADDVLISEEKFTSHSRYAIEVKVPEEAKTGKLELYTADLTVVDKNSVEYQIIKTDEALEVGTPAIAKVKGREEAAALGNIVAKAGEKITITGTYFNVVADVTIGGVSATDITISEDGTTLTATLPAAAPSGDILLVCKSGVEVPVGTLTTVKPTNAVAAPNPVKAGQALTINGQDMDVVSAVQFEGADAVSGDNLTIAADKVIVKAVPETATEGTLKLVMANGETVDVAFTLVKPTITAYNVNPVSAGGALQITGTDLDLVKSINFGDGKATIAEGDVSADGKTITITVPMEGKSGKPVFNLANGTSVEGLDLQIDEAVFCYATALPGEEVELKAGNSMTLIVANGDKLTGVEMNGEACQWILTGDDKNQLIIGIPESAKAKSVVRLISSNGEISYNITVIPATSVKKTLWSGLTEITWSDGGRVTVPAASFEGVPAGAVLTFCYTQKDQVWGQAQINYGDWTGINFNQSGEDVYTFNQTLVPTDIYGWFQDGVLNRETSVILTQEILDNILAKKGGCEDKTDCGIIIQGSDLIFTKIMIAWEIPSEVTVWEGEAVADNWGGQPYILSDGGTELLAAGMKVGSIIRCYLTVMPGESSWNCQIVDGHWDPNTAFEGCDFNNGNWNLEEHKGAIEFTVTDFIYEHITKVSGWGGSFLLNGDNVICTKVTIE